MEMLLAFTLLSSGVGSMLENIAGGATSSYLPSMLAKLLFSRSLFLKLVFQWFADAPLASHINSNSMTRCLVHFSQHTLQP